jgi:hypothetical protein
MSSDPNGLIGKTIRAGGNPRPIWL